MGQLKFDAKKAREICEELLHPGQDCGASCQFCDEAKKVLPAALDRIEEMEKDRDYQVAKYARICELEQLAIEQTARALFAESLIPQPLSETHHKIQEIWRSEAAKLTKIRAGE